MKTQLQKQWTKIACVTFAIFSMVTVANAQTITGDITKNPTGALNGFVRVVDNKGTVKYLQAKNGITTLTNTTADVTTTTWQLGGTLTDNTYIDVDGKVFGFDGIDLVNPAVLAASADATTGSDHGTGTGWTLLVRDEATGAIKKLKAIDMITSGQTVFTATAAQTAFVVTAGTPAMAGSQIPLPVFSKVWVYRNGAKLVAGVDYTVATNTVTLVPNAIAPNDWAVLAGDVIEVQYFK
jgi:hypothetical protein